MGTIPNLEDCNSGIQAVGFSAIVAIEVIEEKRGGIFIPDSVRDKEEIVTMRGRLVSLGSAAFDFASFAEAPVKIGDPVMIAHLAGKRFKGADEKHYRIMTDRDIIGLIKEEAHG